MRSLLLLHGGDPANRLFCTAFDDGQRCQLHASFAWVESSEEGDASGNSLVHDVEVGVVCTVHADWLEQRLGAVRRPGSSGESWKRALDYARRLQESLTIARARAVPR